MNKNLKAMSDYTITSRYARFLPEQKRRATWKEQVKIVEDMHLKKYPEAEEDIKWGFDFVEKKRVLGSQRALQFGGDPIIKKNARIYNCTASYADRPRFFQEAFWLLLCGCGVGFSIQTHHVAKLPKIIRKVNPKYKIIDNGKVEEITYVVPDTIEGWSDSLGILLSSYFADGQPFPQYYGKKINFDFSLIREKGAPLTSGVGKAPGPEGLKNALIKVEHLLDSIVGNSDKPIRLKPINVYDIVMHASDAVLSGGVRRCLPEYYSIQMLDGTWKNIKDIKVGDKILFKGKGYPVQNKFDNGIKKLLKINTKEGYHVSTPEHRWLVYDHQDKEIKWVAAKNLKDKKYSFLRSKVNE